MQAAKLDWLLRKSGQLMFLRLMSSKGTRPVHASTGNSSPVMRENSAEFSMDGGKFQCGLQFSKDGARTVEEESMIVEMARAKAFDDSLNKVAIVNLEAGNTQS